MVKAKKFVYIRKFDGLPKDGDVKLEEEELPPIKDGEFLAEALYLSVDPYMRAFGVLGQTLLGQQVAKIIESKNKKFPVGTLVISQFGWRTHTISDGVERGGMNLPFYTVPNIKGLSPSLYLGVLGMPGNTAYFGLLDVCKPKPGETLVVNAAGGAVGSHVGQIGKIKGLTVIGIAGSDEKGKWLKSVGFDHYINYKTEDLKTALAKAAPKGVDAYFDNVGGEISSIVLQQMNVQGRICVCGAISTYNEKELPKATVVQPSVLGKTLTMQGFHVALSAAKWEEGVAQNTKWVQEGKLKFKETVTEGFENTFKAFVGVLTGENIGKAIVKV